MTYAIQNLLSVLRMTAGRRLLALDRMLARALARPEAAALTTPFADAIARQHSAVKVAAEWRCVQGDLAIHGEDARALDASLDRAVGAFHGALEGIVRGLDDPEQALARKVLAAVFPHGAGPLLNLAFVDQHAEVCALVAALDRATELGQAVLALNLGVWIPRIDALNQAYGRALSRPARLTWDEVRAADDDAFEALGEMVARIVGLYPTNKPADVAAREALLEPLVIQQQQFTALRAQRRAAKAAERARSAVTETETETDADADALAGAQGVARAGARAASARAGGFRADPDGARVGTGSGGGEDLGEDLGDLGDLGDDLDLDLADALDRAASASSTGAGATGSATASATASAATGPRAPA